MVLSLQNWELDALIEHFTFFPNEMQQIGKRYGSLAGEVRRIKNGGY